MTSVSTVFSLGFDFLIKSLQKSKPKKTTEQQSDGGFRRQHFLLVLGVKTGRLLLNLKTVSETERVLLPLHFLHWRLLPVHSSSVTCVFTIEQLVDKDEVILDIFLTDLAEVNRHDITHLVKELKHHGGVDILLGDSCQPDVGASDVEEAGPGEVGDRRADLLPGVDDIHPKRVYRISPRGRRRDRDRDKHHFL